MADDFNFLEEIKAVKDPQALIFIERLCNHFNERISHLEDHISKLEEKIARLEKNSSNSSKPPSSDIVKADSKQRRPGKRKIGGQKGRKGKNRKSFSKEELDRVEELSLCSCPDCGDKLQEFNPDISMHQCVSLPERPVEVVEYHRVGKLCTTCKVYQYPKLPSGVVEGQLFDLNLQSLIGYLKGSMGASYTELASFCKDVLKIEVSRGMLSNVVSRISDSLEMPYDELKDSLPEQKQLNIDETGWKDLGKKHWVWVFCNPLMSFFTISPSRGSKVLRETLGENFKGAITSDFFSSYISFASDKQQFCLAHLIRDVKFLVTLPDKESKIFGEKLVRYFKMLFRLWHKRSTLSDEQFEKKVTRIKNTISNLVIASSFKKGEAKKLQRRILKRWEGLFKFTQNQELYEPTNNAAKRTLRHLIRIRRQTQGSRGIKGQQWNERIATVLETCKKQQKSAWKFIRQAMYAFNGQSIYPTLSTH